jgi:2-isopropylmalate synthase
MKKVYLFDTTLRDGAQTSGVDFSAADKQKLAKALDDFGMHYIEGGWPGANDTDDTFFANAPQFQNAKLTAFGMTRRVGTATAQDTGLNKVLNTPAPVVCLVGKTWDVHVYEALQTTLDDNLNSISETITYAKAQKSEVVYDLEHFFDAWKANKNYTLKCMRAARNAGADWLVMCDTNGGTFPDEIRQIISDVLAEGFNGNMLGIHTHNDMDCAVANTFEAAILGVQMLQGTLNGLGERCGNANLITLIPMLTKRGFDCGVTPEKMRELKKLSHTLDDILNRTPNTRAAFVGDDAFTHKGGLHGSAVAKNPALYEHTNPDSVGNKRSLPMSSQGGLANLEARLHDFRIEYNRTDPRLRTLIKTIKTMSSMGYAFDLADASLELLARKQLCDMRSFFEVESITTHCVTHDQHEKISTKFNKTSVAETNVKLTINGQRVICVDEGNGPVNAIDNALRKALTGTYPTLNKFTLSDYKVRILKGNDATGAITSVRVTSKGIVNEQEMEWSTIAASTNIMEASAQALLDAYQWFLLKTELLERQHARKTLTFDRAVAS